MKLYFKNGDFELKLEGTVEELEQFSKPLDDVELVEIVKWLVLKPDEILAKNIDFEKLKKKTRDYKVPSTSQLLQFI